MLKIFDWIRLSYTCSELLATIQCFKEMPEIFSENIEIGPPLLSTEWPCQRCWIYSCLDFDLPNENHCKTCDEVLKRAKVLVPLSRRLVILWGLVSFVPSKFKVIKKSDNSTEKINEFYSFDDNHFIAIINRQNLLEFLKEFLFYSGSELKGLIQIFTPPIDSKRHSMADVFCRIVHLENRFPMDCLRVRFFSAPYQIFEPQKREKEGNLTFEIDEFMQILEMTSIFRSLIRPNEQALMADIVNLNNEYEEKFYWGRFLSFLDPKAKDMIEAWNLRNWPKSRIKFIYELMDYVTFTFSN